MKSFTEPALNKFEPRLWRGIGEGFRITSFLFFLFSLSLSLVRPLFGGAELLDRVVGVVGDDVITQSELEEAVLTLGGFGTTQNQADVLNQLIERKLLLIQASKDSLEAKPDEIKDAVDNAMLEIRGRFPSDSAYLGELAKAGMTEVSLKEKYGKQIKETLLIQKLFQKKFGKELTVTDVEAREFFNTHKDSIPPEPAGVRLLGVVVQYKISDEVLARTRSKAQKVLKLAQSGKTFGDLVKTYSDDEKTKAQGGVLGTVEIKDLSPDIRSTVAGLKEGEVTLIEMPPVSGEPASGKPVWHIMRCDAKYKDMATLRDIIIKAVPTHQDSLSAQKLAERVKEKLQKDTLFNLTDLSDSGVEIISKGEGFVPLNLTSFASLNEIHLNEVYTFLTPDGWQIIKPIEVREEQSTEWEKVRKELKNFLYERRITELSRGLIEKLKQEIYTKIML